MGTKRIAVGVVVGLAGFAGAFGLGRVTAGDESSGADTGPVKMPLVLSITSPGIDVPAPVQGLPALASPPAPPPPTPQPAGPTEVSPPPPPPPPPPVTTGIG